MANRIFKEFDVLIPDKNRVKDINLWPVVAVDQFTSQPEYWSKVQDLVKDNYSAYYLVLPEVELLKSGFPSAERVKKINDTMRSYLDNNILKEYKNAYVYVERKLINGTVRTGIIGIVDLEKYDYRPELKSEIRATERTVTERIPPRKAIREGAPLELTHVLMLCDDYEQKLIKPFELDKSGLEKIYSIDLMCGGGHIDGWLVSGDAAEKFDLRLDDYIKARSADNDKPLIFAVGDGNHSLATAKEFYEDLKRKNNNLDLSQHPARYAMVELENIHDESQVFEPVHRLLKGVDNIEELLNDIKKICVDNNIDNNKVKGAAWPVEWVSGDKSGVIYLDKKLGSLATEVLQNYLDEYMRNKNNIEIDFIHEDDALRSLAGESSNNIGFMLPPLDKSEFFNWIIENGILPRKTFSMGHAQEKRYYLEARKIVK